jgi:hypothetical protein
MCSSRKEADRAHAEYSAARGRLLRAIADLIATEAWRGDGAGNLPTWLSARWQISSATARELVREADALRKGPALAASLEAGTISPDQCKALAVLSDEGSDAEAWLEGLEFWSLPELQRAARKKVARELERRDDGVYLRMEHTPDERYMRGTFQLHPEDGAAVLKAVESRIPSGTALRDWDKAAAAGLVEVCTGETRSATVVLSIGSDDVTGSLDSGGFVGAETARRLSCDARVQTVANDADGNVTGIGRTSRVVPPWLRRVIETRDRGMCTFPGCERKRYLECHHIVPWAKGGATDAHNLLTTCWKHHKLLHEGGWSVFGVPGPHVGWLRPDGSPFEPRAHVSLDSS